MGKYIDQPLELPCGLTLRNRLAKAAMAEWMADADGLPDASMQKPYGSWAGGHWGLVITGNVQVDVKHLGGYGDVALNEDIDPEKQLQAWKAWAASCNSNGTTTIVQLNHPGRQSPWGAGRRGFFEKALAPSAIRLELGSYIANNFVFGTPKEMTVEEIQDVVRRFAKTARLSWEAGFAGIELHAAHGYLLAQFMSADSNKRTDEYGGSPAARVRIVLDIIRAIRAEVPKEFCIGIKANSVDHQSAEALKDCVEQLKLIEAAGIDFLEISGGTYENPMMIAGKQPTKSERTLRREAFFLEFAEVIRSDLPNVLLMVTGGFRTRGGIDDALSNGACDIVGLGRPAVLEPALPSDTLLRADLKDEDAKLRTGTIQSSFLLRMGGSFLQMVGSKGVGAGQETRWYTEQIQKMK